jgi:hypothetical protein
MKEGRVDPSFSRYFARHIYLTLKEGARHTFRAQERAFFEEHMQAHDTWKRSFGVLLEDTITLACRILQVLFIGAMVAYVVCTHCVMRAIPVEERALCDARVFALVDPFVSHTCPAGVGAPLIMSMICGVFNFIVIYAGMWVEMINLVLELVSGKSNHFCDALLSVNSTTV